MSFGYPTLTNIQIVLKTTLHKYINSFQSVTVILYLEYVEHRVRDSRSTIRQNFENNVTL